MMDFSRRSEEAEIMDDLRMDGKELRRTLDLLSRINEWLGGNSVILDGVEKLLRHHPASDPVRIVDLGCGNGDMLRRLHDFARKKGYKVELLGIDANEDAVKYASELSKGMPNIDFKAINLFSEDFRSLDFDIALSTLFLHHFTDEQILEFLPAIERQARIGIVVNDLHRSHIAYGLFWGLSLLFNNKVARTDGLISIRKAFRRKELDYYATQMPAISKIDWRWAFRYQWIISKK